MISSSCRDHAPRLMSGFRWLCHLQGEQANPSIIAIWQPSMLGDGTGAGGMA